MSLAAPDVLALWRRDIRRFAWDNFQFVPDTWQNDVCDAWDRGDQRIAMQACKGPGKTALMAIFVWQFLATRENALVPCTSISGDNLRDGLWTELARWQAKSPLLSAAFEWTASAVRHREFPSTWFAAARTWSRSASPETQGQTLAGLHADYMLFALDETGGMPEAIMVAAEAALATGREMRLLQAGNPLQCDGPLWVAAHRDRKLWTIFEITSDPDDPKRAARVPVSWAKQQIEAHGRDNPWVMANVLGKFPSASPLAFIAAELIDGAAKREATAQITDAFLIGVDVARFGDDKTVIRFRKGRDARSHAPIKLRNLDNVQVASRVAQLARHYQADGVFIDEGGNGGGVLDILRSMNVPNLFGVNFGAKSDAMTFGGDQTVYANKGAEMYGSLRAWLPAGAIDDDPELRADLGTRRYAYKILNGREAIVLEPKDAMKQRGLASPDDGDALALTFAFPIQPHARAGIAGAEYLRPTNQVLSEYDPFAERPVPGAPRTTDYNPF